MPPLDPPVATAALDALDAGVLVVREDGLVVAWNSWMASASGVAEASALDRTLAEIFPDARLARLLSAVRDAITSGSSSLLTHTTVIPPSCRLQDLGDRLRTCIGAASIAVRPFG